MANIVTKTYDLNIAPGGCRTVVNLSQYENGRLLVFHLVGDSTLSIPSGSTAVIEGTKPDGNVYSGSGTVNVEAGTVTFQEATQMTAAAGEYLAKVKILHGANMVASGNIAMVISADPVSDDAVRSDSDLQGLIAEARETYEGTQNQVDVLASRMDEFTRLPDGSTTGDAELADIRVAADGTIYPTAGDAVRGQVTDLKSALEDATGNVIYKLTSGYIATNGTTTNYVVTPTVAYYHAVIDCTAGDVFCIDGVGGISPRLWAFVKADGTIIDPRANTNAHLAYGTITAPQDASKLIVNVNSATGFVSKQIPLVIRVDKVEDDLSNISRGIKGPITFFDKINFLNPSITNNQAINSAGSKVNSNGYAITEDIPLKQGQTIRVVATALSAFATIARRNNLSVSSWVVIATGTGSESESTYTAPFDTYITVTYETSSYIEIETGYVKPNSLGYGKKIVFYGDSLIESANPYFAIGHDTWGTMLQKAIVFDSYIGVGIGGTRFVEGNTISYPSGFQNGDSLGNIDTGNSPGTEKASFCDWYRIDKTIPADVDIILIGTGANDIDTGIAGNVDFIANDTTDSAWASSEGYSTYNGDYDITTVKGAIASTIMKMQVKAPNAKIFIMNFCNSRGTSTNDGTATKDKAKTYTILDSIKEVCGEFGIEVIDLFAESGINPLNRSQYVADGIHLTVDGYTKMMSVPIITAVRNYLESKTVQD